MTKGGATKDKTYTIVVNGREKIVEEKELSYWDVISLAFDDPAPGPRIFFTVAFRRGQGDKPQGTLVDGESVRVKNRMIFDVTRTDKS